MDLVEKHVEIKDAVFINHLLATVEREISDL